METSAFSTVIQCCFNTTYKGKYDHTDQSQDGKIDPKMTSKGHTAGDALERLWSVS